MRNIIISAFVVVVFLAGFPVMDASGNPGERGKWEAQMLCDGGSVGEAKIRTSGDMKVEAEGGCIDPDTDYRVCLYGVEGGTPFTHDVGSGLVTSDSDAELKVVKPPETGPLFKLEF